MRRHLSVGAKWTLRYMAAMVVTLSIFSIYIYTRVEQRIDNGAKALVELQLAELREAVQRAPHKPALWRNYAHQHVVAADPDLRLGIEIFDASGKLQVAEGSLAAAPLSLPERLRSGREGHIQRNIDLGGKHPYLMVASRTANGFAIATIYTREFQLNAYHIRDALLGAMPALLILTGALGWWLSHGSLRPIAAITRTARRISSTHLDEQIPTTGSRDELDELASTLNDMVLRIREGMERMRRFSADAAHELRTPLTALRNQIEVTLDQKRSPEEYRHVFDDVLEQVEHLAETVHAMLRLASSEAGLDPRHRKVVELSPLLENVCEFFEPLADERGVSLELKIPAALRLEGDPVWLHQLFANLTHNAVKYTPEGGHVRIEVEAAGERVAVRVRDDGVGLAEKDRERIFERFQRGEESRPAPGVGLGLPLAREIARAHGGSIDVAGSPGRGTTFTVWLPLARTNPPRVPESPAASAA